ncbi:MAG: Uma2 family endonuclease [Deltaproteobacteria bacterium]|nr:MAG: Uma2 family endonuclease [Deltaproteobacteria bacterium]
MSVTELIAEKYADTEYSDVEYPDSDGEPMGETGFHVTAILHLLSALRQYFINNDNIYVAGDMFLYYKQGFPRYNKAPDVMVIKGVENHERRSFKMWEENTGPCVIFEITSKSTKNDDMIGKKELYASLDVQEYFLFDPLRDYLKTSLLGFRLKKGRYAPLPIDSNGYMTSRELGVYLIPEGNILRVVDPRTREPVPVLDEAMDMLEAERKRAEKAETERKNAETGQQRAEAERKKAEMKQQRAEAERKKAEMKQQRAEAEAEAERKNVEAERKKVEKLAAKLRSLGIEPE